MTGPSADPAAAATPRAGDYLAAATEIAEQLRERAVWHAGRCTWLGYDVDPVGDRWTTVYRTIDESLYGGLPGVALFLAELFALTGEPGDADAASGAIRQALWLLHHQRRVARHGFYSGEAGILWAIREVEERLDAVLDDGWCGDAERRLLGPADLDGPAELDLVDGISGTIAGLLARRGAKDRPEVVESCRRWAERLIGASRAGPGVGRSWSGAASEPLARQPLCGLAHGASSAALALLELWSAAGDDRYREAAFEGFRYERQWFSRRHGNWPDLRDAAGPEPSRPEHRADLLVLRRRRHRPGASAGVPADRGPQRSRRGQRRALRLQTPGRARPGRGRAGPGLRSQRQRLPRGRQPDRPVADLAPARPRPRSPAVGAPPRRRGDRPGAATPGVALRSGRRRRDAGPDARPRGHRPAVPRPPCAAALPPCRPALRAPPTRLPGVV
jgi:hypothetical protein